MGHLNLGNTYRKQTRGLKEGELELADAMEESEPMKASSWMSVVPGFGRLDRWSFLGCLFVLPISYVDIGTECSLICRIIFLTRPNNEDSRKT